MQNRRQFRLGKYEESLCVTELLRVVVVAAAVVLVTVACWVS